MVSKYKPDVVEAKWRKIWTEQGADQLDMDKAERPFYNLMMFPYPSAEGLHVGNVFAFVGSDIQGRYHRLLGYDVFEPMGFDAFGMHSENFALKQGRHPAEMVPTNVERFREQQLKKIGLMVDWSREINTTVPEYYRWTQWLFVTLYKNGFAYKKKASVNWCPDCQTVLAAEQVIDGECERCSAQVTKKDLEQWYFKTTAFAKELLEGLDHINWSERTKTAQRNWIGRSQGAEIVFRIQNGPDFKIFTTRPDTLFGVTYIVFSPEHPLLDKITAPEQKAALTAYRDKTAKITEIDRQAEGREKTGIFIGAYAVNPINNETIPVWAADYVLMGYGTGAIMAVPAHDQRDFDFAAKFNLPLRQVISPDGRLLEKLNSAYTGEGTLVNSGRFDQLPTKEIASREVIRYLANQGLAETKTNYRLRDWCVSRQRYWGPPIPIIYCDKCGIVPVPEKDLPVFLPFLENYRPNGDEHGLSPLRRHEDFYHTLCPDCGGAATRETDVSDNFLCSAWYFYRYPSTEFNDRPFDVARLKKWLPVDLYVGGNEHAVLHLLYSRWLCKALHWCGILDFDEPYRRFVAHGLIVSEGAKMSKSRGNIINPDAYIDEFGADAFRMYLMFMGAYLEGGDFREGGVRAMKSFLDRLWLAILPSENGFDSTPLDDPETLYSLNSTIKAMTTDLARFSYNTAIARLMELVNHITKNQIKNKTVSEVVIRLLAPLAPHMAEELWQRLGHAETVFRGGWPIWDEAAVVRINVEYVIQISGKVRARMQLPAGLTQAEVEPLVFNNSSLARWLEGKTIVKKIHVPDKLLNLVVKPSQL
ncbi:MAG: leucine--tRNA ligase [Candidatus Adiutrix intracellularis]|jgi:leucyl-tRNA synthetase|nr:MAG: leucine--tRNA ligase [Candidatus Adiutrix intracellularis]MDR2827631.1 leucine--tRNA ligase [Candidatus Adiutrix intracellularis]